VKAKARLRSTARRLFSSLFHYSGYSALKERWMRGGGGRILCYHDVSDDSASPYAVSTQAFRQQMCYLAEHCAPTSVDELVRCIESGHPMPERAIAVTLDDGYLGVYTHALPILRKYGIPATVFLPTACIDGQASGYAGHDWAQAEFMNWDQVRALVSASRRGAYISLGSHTLTHLSLPTGSQAQIEAELLESKRRIEAETGETVNGLAYPYGLARDYRGAEAYVARAGYRWAVTGVHGTNRGGRDLYALRRTKVDRYDDMRVFARLIEGAMDPWQVFDLARRKLGPTSGDDLSVTSARSLRHE
jgi:peptidoglycan/xylan/chitin deacetylase (PgdA/CDA1 family)